MKAVYKEKSLVNKVQRHSDANAFSELYDLYIQKIYRFILVKVGQKTDAEDLTSEVFLKTWNYLVSHRDDKIRSFSGLIYRIARNTMVDFFRTMVNRQSVSLDELDIDILVEDKHVKRIAIKSETRAIMEVMKTMKREYQEVIFLKYIEEFSTAEIADIMGKKPTNVRVTLHRAMSLLQKKMGEQGDTAGQTNKKV